MTKFFQLWRKMIYWTFLGRKFAECSAHFTCSWNKNGKYFCFISCIYFIKTSALLRKPPTRSTWALWKLFNKNESQSRNLFGRERFRDSQVYLCKYTANDMYIDFISLPNCTSACHTCTFLYTYRSTLNVLYKRSVE